MPKRTFWRAGSLDIKDEPLSIALLKYRFHKDRQQVPESEANLISSQTESGRQMPILDLDFPHHIEKSSNDGHSHLYFDTEISNLKWFVLMCALRFAGLIEEGFFVWSLRRRGNFVRLPNVKKESAGEKVKPSYGWFFRIRNNRS